MCDVALEKGQTILFKPTRCLLNLWALILVGVQSPFGIVITQWTDDQIHVLYAEEFERPDYNEMLSKIWSLMSEFELSKKNGKIYVDGANPSFIKSLKIQLGEDPDYDKVIAYYKLQKWDWTKKYDRNTSQL